MTTMAKKAVCVTSSALMLASMGAGAAVLMTDQPALAATPAADEATEEGIVDGTVMLDEVMGTFSYSQATTATVDVIRAAMAKAGQYLCGGLPIATGEVDASGWAIKVGGMVDEAYATTIGDLQEDDALVSQLMGCACAGNPADGGAARRMCEGEPDRIQRFGSLSAYRGRAQRHIFSARPPVFKGRLNW